MGNETDVSKDRTESLEDCVHHEPNSELVEADVYALKPMVLSSFTSAANLAPGLIKVLNHLYGSNLSNK